MTSPTININGTYGPSLLEDVERARDAIYDAIQALRAMEPNGRDYLDSDALHLAQQAHRRRIGHLFDINDELLHLHIAIDKQISV